MASRRKVYDEYIASDDWRAKRSEYFTDPGTDSSCAGCGYSGVGIEIHHRTYERLGNEQLDDLVAVCYRCHTMIHDGFSSWSNRLASHTDNVLAGIRRLVATGDLEQSTPNTRRRDSGVGRRKQIANRPAADKLLGTDNRKPKKHASPRSEPKRGYDPNLSVFEKVRDRQRDPLLTEKRRNGL